MLRACLLWCCLSLCPLAAWGGTLQVIYPYSGTANDVRFRDLLEVLRTALEKTTPEYGPFELRPFHDSMNEARYLFELKSGHSINIAWSSTSVEKEQEFLPIRVPLRKGLLGYRVALIAAGAQGKVDRVQTLDDLRHLTVGQGIGWGDVLVYQANGIRVVTANYDNLFKMTALSRFDLFPRGVGEILAEYELFHKEVPNLAIENNLLLYYPWPYYFFFNKKDLALKSRIEAGLRLMLHDGSFDQLFKRYNSKAIELIKLRQRRIIHLQNPLLPKETPLSDASLWFDPAR